MAVQACETYGYEVDPEIKRFSQYITKLIILLYLMHIHRK